MEYNEGNTWKKEGETQNNKSNHNVLFSIKKFLLFNLNKGCKYWGHTVCLLNEMKITLEGWLLIVQCGCLCVCVCGCPIKCWGLKELKVFPETSDIFILV